MWWTTTTVSVRTKARNRVPWISTTIVLLLILSCLFWVRIMLMNPRPLSLVMLIFYHPLTFAKSNTSAPIWNFLSWWIPSPPTQSLNPQTCWFFLLSILAMGYDDNFTGVYLWNPYKSILFIPLPLLYSRPSESLAQTVIIASWLNSGASLCLSLFPF